MKHRIWSKGVLAGVLAMVMVGCEMPTVNEPVSGIALKPGNGGGGGGGGGKPGQVVYQVEFTDGFITGNGVPYIDGEDKVDISVTETAVKIRPNTAKRGGSRWILLDFSDAVAIRGDADLQDGFSLLSGIAANPLPFGGDSTRFDGNGSFVIDVDIEGMAEDEPERARAQLTWTPVDRLHKLRFGQFFQDVDGDGMEEPATLEGDSVTVTRTSSTTWEVESQPSEIAILKDDDAGPSRIVGGYHMSFLMTITKN